MQADPCIVHDNVQPAKGVGCLGHEALHSLEIGNVNNRVNDTGRNCGQFLCRGFERAGVEVADGEARPFRGKATSDRSADAGCCG